MKIDGYLIIKYLWFVNFKCIFKKKIRTKQLFQLIYTFLRVNPPGSDMKNKISRPLYPVHFTVIHTNSGHKKDKWWFLASLQADYHQSPIITLFKVKKTKHTSIQRIDSVYLDWGSFRCLHFKRGKWSNFCFNQRKKTAFELQFKQFISIYLNWCNLYMYCRVG